jgi:hypothetical protein
VARTRRVFVGQDGKGPDGFDLTGHVPLAATLELKQNQKKRSQFVFYTTQWNHHETALSGSRFTPGAMRFGTLFILSPWA